MTEDQQNAIFDKILTFPMQEVVREELRAARDDLLLRTDEPFSLPKGTPAEVCVMVGTIAGAERMTEAEWTVIRDAWPWTEIFCATRLRSARAGISNACTFCAQALDELAKVEPVPADVLLRVTDQLAALRTTVTRLETMIQEAER